MLDGQVIRIGPDATPPDNQQQSKEANPNKQQPTTYKAVIAFDSRTLDMGDKKHKLMAGMQVVAEINQGRRTVMQFLLSPVTKTFEESGHER